ncbi:hypothetical protein FS595_09080 [Serratia rubidaea]|uniref:hypothetical protein n=1 Tax=Serratia rubidaea TaxID=61652 RepID=UPI001F206C5A|nr:hypothetical protein [Serratia rubidaea]UJD79843.1 hypothetical protein FS596_09080 [Serratia rubidaea]UJD84399.1 hypothetical protein FS595_09080 [Serratia rubidaea]
MKQAYKTLIEELLQQYHTKAKNLQQASAVADAVRQVSMNDYAFRLSIGLTGLLSTAEAAGDGATALVIDHLISRCSNGDIPSINSN